MAPMEIVPQNCPRARATRCLVSCLAAAVGTLPPVAPHSMAPMEEVIRTCPSSSQGGGVYVNGGTAPFLDCEIYGNTAASVRLALPLSMAPMEAVSRN